MEECGRVAGYEYLICHRATEHREGIDRINRIREFNAKGAEGEFRVWNKRNHRFQIGTTDTQAKQSASLRLFRLTVSASQ